MGYGDYWLVQLLRQFILALLGRRLEVTLPHPTHQSMQAMVLQPRVSSGPASKGRRSLRLGSIALPGHVQTYITSKEEDQGIGFSMSPFAIPLRLRHQL